MSYTEEVSNRQIESILSDIYDKREFGKLTRPQLKTLEEFYKHCVAESLKPKSALNYLRDLRRLGEFSNKAFGSLTVKDLENFLSSLTYLKNLGDRKKGERVSENYVNEMKITLKKFFKWLYGRETYPKVVSWIKIKTRKIDSKLPEELLTPEDVKAIVEKASNTRDRALIMMLYESGCRASEILTLKLKHVVFDQYGAVIIVSGKTGMRRVRLVNSAPDLQLWVNHHPFRKDVEMPLFVDLGSHINGRQLGYYALLHIVKLATKKSGIKKKVYPHLFRHSRLTELAKYFTEAELKILAGWTGSSNMPKVYVHLSGADVENKLLMMHGKLTPESIEKEKEKKEVLKPKDCPRCKQVNSPTALFCERCSFALDFETAMKIEEKRKRADDKMSLLIQKHPELQELIEKLLEKEFGK